MVATFSGILAKGSWAFAQEPPLHPDAGSPVGETPRSAPEASDAGAPPSPSAGAKPANDVAPSTTLAPQGGGSLGVAAPSAQAEAEAAPEEGKKKKKKKKDKSERDRDDTPGNIERVGAYGSFQLKGRVISRAEFDRSEVEALDDNLQPITRTVDSLDLSVPSARLSFNYKSPWEWLTAVAELDIAGKPDMKDGYVQLKDSHWSLRVGQFRVPVASIEMTSPWTLPFVRRGLVRDVLTDRLDYGGRRPGVAVGWRDHSIALRPRLIVGAFQGSYLAKDPTPTERDTDLLNGMKFPSQSFVARGEIEVLGAELGVYYEDRVGSPAVLVTDRYWSAGADITFDHTFDNGGFRFWLDALAGSSWYELSTKTPDNKEAIFSVARALIAYRFGGVADEQVYVEPFVYGAVLDPDADVKTDMLYEGAVGVNVGYWKRARLTLQTEINKGQRNFPIGYFMGPPPDRIGVILQAGVAF